MATEPLLPTTSIPRSLPVILAAKLSSKKKFLSSSLHDDDDPEAAFPSPPALKHLLIYGPSSSSSTPFFDSLLSDEDDSWLTDPSAATRWSSNLHRSVTAPAMAELKEIKPPAGAKAEAPPHRPSVIRWSFLLLIVYLALGIATFTFHRSGFSSSSSGDGEINPVIDGLYFCIVTMCTIGYGDITPTSPFAKLFAVTFVIVGFGFIDVLLSGMVSYVLDLQEALLLSAVSKPMLPEKDGDHPRKEDHTEKNHKHGHNSRNHRRHHLRQDIARHYIVDLKKGRMHIRMKVALALGVVLLCIGVGAFVLRYVEHLCWLDAFYLSVMSVTTVGYGDQAFKTQMGRMFASLWLLLSTLAVARAFLYLAEARIDKRHREYVNWKLTRDMTVSEFLEADADHNGFITKSEFVVYMLKEMEKVSEKDVKLIIDQFDKLDTGNFGKISLSDFIESRH